MKNEDFEKLAKVFREKLRAWYGKGHRDLPWRETKDPYKIWLSEIILQQTRTEQGRAYYERFVENWATINDLSDAKEEDVLKAWQGLGYYTRARNLHKTAHIVSERYRGEFPSKYDEIRELPGIGDYTAAAIASFAFGGEYAVLDGNVYRVLGRCLGIEDSMDESNGKKRYRAWADLLLDNGNPSEYNQAMMELGAMVCTPKGWRCEICPLEEICYARETGQVARYPLRTKKKNVKTRYLNYVAILRDGMTWIRMRTSKDIWRNLYEFPMEESESPWEEKNLLESRLLADGIDENGQIKLIGKKDYKHQLTHQTICARLWIVETEGYKNLGDGMRIKIEKEIRFPIHRLMEEMWKTVNAKVEQRDTREEFCIFDPSEKEKS